MYCVDAQELVTLCEENWLTRGKSCEESWQNHLLAQPQGLAHRLQVDTKPFMARLSKDFHAFVEKGLQRLERRERHSKPISVALLKLFAKCNSR